ncbi:MAG TPA: DUF3617 family protein [Desulfuromonadales bacterium]|nr:DUF3617 family protein [Desulfuromonadales bacterium]
MRGYLASLLLLAFMLIPSAALAEPNVREGLYEIETTTEMPGMGFTMPAVPFSQCITKEDIIPRQQPAGQDCELLESRIECDTVTWKMRCQSEGGPITSTGRLIYHGDSFEGTVETISDQIPGGMLQIMKGSRNGPCPP